MPKLILRITKSYPAAGMASLLEAEYGVRPSGFLFGVEAECQIDRLDDVQKISKAAKAVAAARGCILELLIKG
jgi:hypothetical protein